MASAKKNSKNSKPAVSKPVIKPEKPEGEDRLDEQEEKILDWILKGVVAFILGWLGLAILMVLGGYFHLWG